MCILTICILCSNFCTSVHYPPQAPLDDILKFANTNDGIPYMNNKHYLRELSGYAASEVITQVLIIIGPKDSGKSRGLTLISKSWIDKGHAVLDINLKGNKRSGQEMMLYISYKLMKTFSSIQFNSYKDLFDIIFTDCATKMAKESNFVILVKWIVTHDILSAIFAAVLFPLLAIFYIRKYSLILILLMLLLFAVPLYFIWYNPISLIEYMGSINHSISDGDWITLMCYLNKLVEVKPENRPILLIREINNLDNDTLLSCLSALETAKENLIMFPIIMETSDSTWDAVAAVKNSRSSFTRYYMQEMSYYEGLTEVVYRLKLFKKKDYDIIYKTLGGHIGSYHTLLTIMKQLKLEQALEKMKRSSFAHLTSCIRQSENATDAILQLKMVNHWQTVVNLEKSATGSYDYLLDCNILYRNENSEIQPQNRLIEDAIIRLLDMMP